MNILRNKTPGPRMANPLFSFSARPYMLVILLVGMAGAHFVNVASAVPTHYLVAFILILLGAAGLIMLRRHLPQIALFGLVIASGIPMFYRVWTQNDPLWDWKGHLEGTIPEPVINLIDLPLILILVTAFFPVIFRRKPLPAWTWLDICILLFLATCLTSFTNAQDHLYAFFELLRYVKYVMLYVALRIFFEKENYGGLMIVALSCIVCLEAIVSLLTGLSGGGLMLYGTSSWAFSTTADGRNITRVAGILGGPNVLGTWLLLPLSVFISYLFSTSNQKHKTIVFLVAMVGLITFLYTFCRSAWGGFIAGCLLLLCILEIRKRLKREYLVALLILVPLVFIATYVSGTASNIKSRIFSDETGAWEVRPELNSIAMRMVKEHPFAGVGLNNFQVVSHRYDLSKFTTVFDAPAHNVFMLFASETGVLGLLFFISMGAYLFYKSILLTKNPTDDYRFCVGVSGAMYLIALFINELGDYTLRYEALLPQCALMAAFVMSVKPLHIGHKAIAPNPEPLVLGRN